jgi:hypothetical protein
VSWQLTLVVTGLGFGLGAGLAVAAVENPAVSRPAIAIPKRQRRFTLSPESECGGMRLAAAVSLSRTRGS